MNWFIAGALVVLPMQSFDWAFMEAQEAFVVEAVGLKPALGSLPPEARLALSLMSDSQWRTRDAGSRIMRDRGFVRACLLGQRLGDPEVRWRCRNVLRWLSSCTMCGGRGVKHEPWYDVECRACLGVGHFWPLEDYGL